MRKMMIALAILAMAGNASAAQGGGGIKGSGTYGTAGCGLGSMAFGNQKGAIQILAATTNGLFGTQTFGITSGTSNCGESAVGLSGTKTFIEANREALAKDMSRGSGETISALTHLAGCADAQAVGAKLQQSFQAVFPEQSISDEAVSANVISTLKADKALSCSELG
ncbi:DUF3015 family protein [Anaeromyxobacter paludicola]|uniref:DUF3015 domain-containing protein n=1 Tax=Anaeromyxobacter paludicola TaxID=2918171 RepID=A0ABM7X8W0_9BACT|nr:DUF3015 family protein [Anaeromyxobacter paludicola]BDG08293.1 hypothetical protein AMPC_14060 [Anaeromyxobacter paludicola]